MKHLDSSHEVLYKYSRCPEDESGWLFIWRHQQVIYPTLKFMTKLRLGVSLLSTLLQISTHFACQSLTHPSLPVLPAVALSVFLPIPVTWSPHPPAHLLLFPQFPSSYNYPRFTTCFLPDYLLGRPSLLPVFLSLTFAFLFGFCLRCFIIPGNFVFTGSTVPVSIKLKGQLSSLVPNSS